MSRSRKSLPTWLLVAAVLLILVLQQRQGGETSAPAPSGGIEAHYQNQVSGQMVEIGGRVQRLLPDDREGSPHQRFVVELTSGHTVLVAHNLDLAQRIPMEQGDPVKIRGQYEWNERGGVVHWTHHDPSGRREGGWVDHAGQRYR